MIKRVLVMADLCTVGQCSLAAAVPVLSACGVEACPLPVALLSTHTVGFEGYSRASVADEAEIALEHLKEQGIKFDGALTMYLGGARETRLAMGCAELLKENALRVADPAIADMGRLYPDLDEDVVEATAALASQADFITPNLTEACLLAHEQPRTECDAQFASRLARRLLDEFDLRGVAITGVELKAGRIGAFAFDGTEEKYFAHAKADRICHGAGDLFSSAMTGLMLAGKCFFDAVRGAEKFVYAGIRATIADKEHFYGLHFEKVLKKL